MSQHRLTSADEIASVDSKSRQQTTVARSLYGDIVQFIEFVAVIGLSVLVAYVYHIEVLITEFDAQLYASAGIIGATVLTALLRRDGLYDFERLLSAGRAIRPVIARWVIVILSLIAFGFTLKVSAQFSRIWLFTWVTASILFLIAARVVAAEYLRRAISADGVFARRVAVVGSVAASEAFTRHAERAAAPISVVGRFSLPSVDGDGCQIAALEKLARTGGVEDVIIASGDADRELAADVVKRLSALPVSVAILSSLHWLDHQGGEVVRIAGAPALRLYRRPLEGWGGIFKNLEDQILGLVIFLAALPIMAVIAVLIKLQGNGPILFSQQRHGFNQEVFRIHKFRTMTVAEDGKRVVQAKRGDARVTPLGRFLRKWSLDELPQLFNVIKGDMSLIGPRPHALAHDDEYMQVVENYSGRHKVKPGITGWAQVNGLRGETSENEKMEARVRYDLEYIDNWSLWFDVKILFMTVIAVLFPKNAY